MTIRGIDYFSGERADFAAFRAAGLSFACRYISTPGNDKNLTPHEVAGLHANGLSIVVVFERTQLRSLEGAAGGTEDGGLAREQAGVLGCPGTVPIYAAVDFDAQPKDMPTVLAYLRAFEAAVAPHPLGVYGGFRVIDTVHKAHGWRVPGPFLWQAGAWSKQGRHPAAHLHQNGGDHVGGVDVDTDRATGPGYGGWAPPGGVLARLDADDLAAIAGLVRNALDEGTGHGQHDWGSTSKAILGTVQANHNDLADVRHALREHT
ncbi:MAG TPA: DUF1906 domain-containing protein [Mycobacteriales bacterium]|nr:DUF1906 domain-containing protein [Mycobacteriales bacterium]